MKMANAAARVCAGAFAVLMGCRALAEELDLSGVWTLTQAETNTVSCPVAVPGGIYTALYEAKHIPDPYFGQNERKTQWPSRVEWDFERTFEAGSDLVGRKSVTLLPGRPKTVTFTRRPSEKATFADFKRALEVTHLRESY